MIKLPQIGPAVLVTAAFIGPGTVITATMAGANYGFSLLWALVFSVFATIVLQEMAARLGVVTQKGLGENIRLACTTKFSKYLSIFLVVSAIVIGNAAYQGGNISGASLGLTHLFEDQHWFAFTSIWPVVIGLLAFSILASGSYRIIEKSLIVLVGVMSIAFLASFFLIDINWADFFSGLLIPSLPSGATLTVIALIGTTVVPYNLFLHSASASKKWQKVEQLEDARKDLYFAIPLGGLISIAIVSTAATAFFGQQIQITNAADIAPALEPVFGDLSAVFIAIGLFAAGISSAVTAPLAAAFALSGILNLNKNLNAWPFKSIWLVILLLGVLIASLGYKPMAVIWFAQVANGVLLPLITVFLLWMMNSQALGQHRNNFKQNMLAGIVVALTLMLSARSLMSAFGLL
ncbi:Nramp family divalent metal transporter [Colwellia psychrerythraea]|uniref:Natural resistance-associated macrophage protein n=1 Tax=Colwellia psychrerythraea TaxID=28229 RepID=A0A099KB66_COLPS|nr:Nramp family divalent metal transporter [Colwellia psychrerythraea]KGJ86848.1 natural resistance-associated macrophage protein [Colwellia psychrerythraea]